MTNSAKNKKFLGYENCPFQRFVKRFLDMNCAFWGLVIFSPTIFVIYLILKFKNDGPVIFKQERIGRYGKPFMLYKFRTMIVESENDGEPKLCVNGDDRLTKVGKFLREHHLDEFPQLWNVLKGDMAIVGPRPERKYFINKIMEYNPDYVLLYKVRPGLFSKATLYNGYTDTIDKMLERLKMDLDYLGKRSLITDTKIVMLTAVAIITGKKF